MPEAVAEELCVKFRNIDEIQEFAKAVNQFDGDVDLKQGRITIDAKSLLGICSMNIEEEMELQVFNGDAEELKELIKEISCLKYVYIDNIRVFPVDGRYPF